MVENKTRKIERKEIVVCGICNNAIPKDLLEKSGEGINNLYCQYCGVSLNLTYDPIDNIVSGESPIIPSNTQKESSLTKIKQNGQERDFTLSYSNIRNILRSYFFQLIYQLLKSTPFTLKKIQNKKELKSSHINIVLKKLWKELKDLNLNNLATHELVSSKRRIKNYFEEFQSALRPYKQFRKNNFTLFAENIEFVFGLILGDYEFSNLTTSKKRIVLDLKKNFGFKSDTATTNSFTYNISLIISKIIHSILPQYHITEGNDNKLALDEIIRQVIEYVVNNKVTSSDLSDINSSKKKRFHKTLERLIDNLKTDWIYHKSFEDHIYKLIIIVNSLMSDVNYLSNLSGFERLISQGLTQSVLFERDQEFSPHFKLNLTLILCRVIYLKVKNSPDITKLNSQPVNLSIIEENEVKNSILDEFTAGKKINSQILKKFYKLSLEEFQTYYEKLQQKLTSDLIYVESFLNYISALVRLVFNVVHSISKKSHLTQLELVVIKDLANYNFKWFNKKSERSYFYYLNLSHNEGSLEGQDKKFDRIVEIPAIWLTKYLKDKGLNYISLTNEQKATIRKVYESANKKTSVWFEKDGKKIIKNIIKRTALSNSKIEEKIEEAINDLMKKLESEKPYRQFHLDEIIKDEKGREYISFNDPDFQFALEKIKINPNAYGGLIYVVAIKGLYYCGLTERTIDIRFEEHIMDALRGYISSGGDVNKPGYTKFYDSICAILKICYGDIIKLYRELQTYSALGRVIDRKKKIGEIKSVINPFIKNHIIEIHYGVNSLGKRETQLIKKFPYKTLFEEGILEMGLYDTNGPDFIDLKAKGLNTIAGGTGVGYNFPLYDIAVMLALGFSGRKIARILQSEYFIFTNYNEKKFAKTIQHKIEDVFGGVYKAQKELLKPIIEYLDSIKGLERHEIYLAFKHAELMSGWFSEWSNGREFLISDITTICKRFDLDSKSSWEIIEPFLEESEKYYAGLSESEWLDLFISKPIFRRSQTPKDIETIQDIVKLGDRKLKQIRDYFCNKYDFPDYRSFKEDLQEDKVKGILSQGYFLDSKGNMVKLDKSRWVDQLVPHYINPTYSGLSPERCILRLFRRLTIDQIWDKFYRDSNNLL